MNGILLRNFIIVGLGSMTGGMLRYCTGLLLPATYSRLPIPTLVVNVVGCFLIGLFTALLSRDGHNSASLKLFLTTGLCGGFTTFSTFANENFILIRNAHWFTAATYTIVSIALGLTAVWLGYHLGR